MLGTRSVAGDRASHGAESIPHTCPALRPCGSVPDLTEMAPGPFSSSKGQQQAFTPGTQLGGCNQYCLPTSHLGPPRLTPLRTSPRLTQCERNTSTAPCGQRRGNRASGFYRRRCPGQTSTCPSPSPAWERCLTCLSRPCPWEETILLPLMSLTYSAAARGGRCWPPAPALAPRGLGQSERGVVAGSWAAYCRPWKDGFVS